MSHVETIKRVMSGSYENATPEERALAVKELVQACAVAAAALTIQPFPFVDIALITPIQVAMVQGIGKIYNQSLDQKSVLEILTSIGASLVAQQATIAAAKFVPGLGWIVAMSMAYAMTWAIGEVSEHWFRTGRGASNAELRDMYQNVYKAKKAEREQTAKGNETLKQKLEQLKEARAAELISEEEFERKKQEILSQF